MTEHREFDKIFETKLDEIKKQNENQNKLIAKLNKILLGNGVPENGYVVKHEKLTEKVRGIITTMKLHWGLFILIIGMLVRLAFF